MKLIKLNCPNCNGKIEYKDKQTFRCPFCETELFLQENKVYYVDQTINNYYGTAPVQKKAPVHNKVKMLSFAMLFIACAMVVYLTNDQEAKTNDAGIAIRTVPESDVLLFFLRDIFNKGEAMPTEEEMASIRYLSAGYEQNQWHFSYSFDDPFTNGRAAISDYVIMDKILNTKKMEQKDFEAFRGITMLDLKGTYEIISDQNISFQHMQGLKSYSGKFNESFSQFARYFADKANIEELTTQIRSNNELALLLEFPNLKKLEITYVDESVTDFHLLNQLPLQSLSVHFINDLKWLSSLSNLTSLEVNYSEATDFTSFYSLSQLQALKLTAVKNLKTIDFIQNMPNLQLLGIKQSDITSLAFLEDKTSLTRLQLSSVGQLGSLDFVNSLTSLTELSVSGYYESVPSLSLPNLRKAELAGSFVSRLEAPALKWLTANIGSIDFNGEALVKFPQLEQLSLTGSGTVINIRALNKLPMLRDISADETAFYDETSALFKLEHVNTLSCNECKLELDSANSFTNEALEHLTLNNVSFRMGDEPLKELDKAMPYFANLTALRSFTMQDSSLQSLQFLKEWQQIEELHLENNAILNIEPLVSLPKLQKLYILGNQVQNKSVLDEGVNIY
ncbi:leucine-rich repeat domain-containing protein [Paenibacillaceae bacterium]|nr:leucine-rich repeat domain-containing protein [Paenibacillaceae bacterium]